MVVRRKSSASRSNLDRIPPAHNAGCLMFRRLNLTRISLPIDTRTQIAKTVIFLCCLLCGATLLQAQTDRLKSSDLTRFRDVAQAAISPDGSKVAYTVMNYDRPGRPYPQLWVIDVAEADLSALEQMIP